MLAMPTGAGKTILSAAIVEGALRKGNRVIFTVPRISLIDQTVAAFWREGITDVGVIQSSHPMTNASRAVQVASVQTLRNRDIPPADVVVIDEAHEIFESVVRWMNDAAWRGVPFIGLSATPWTRGLGQHYDDLIVAATTQELIDEGYLAPFRVFAPSHPDLSGVRTVAGDYHEGDLGAAMDRPALTADVVETWRRLGENRPTLCFAVNCAHARGIQARFQEAGIPCGYVDARTSVEERERVGRAFHAGDLRVICNVGVLTTGVDLDVRCIILARPTKSEMLYVQMIGRGLRTADGKSDCLVLDHSDTTQRLGFVTDIHHHELDDGKPRKSQSETKTRAAPLPKECPKCSRLKPAGVHACPSCGFRPERQSGIECEEGELVELRASRKPTPEDKRRFYAQLRGYALERGKSEKWVLAMFRSKFHEWPHGRTKRVGAVECGPEVLGWIRSRQIAWAKSRRGREAA